MISVKLAETYQLL